MGWALTLALWVAALVPGLLALNLPPSPTLFNQAAAWLAWGLVATYGARAVAQRWRPALMQCGAPVGALLLVALAALCSSAWGALPWGLGLAGAGTLAAAALLFMLGAGMGPTPRVLTPLFGAWLAAGVASAGVACIQVFAPAWADGEWIARSAIVGRAVGNLRQPNHLASLLLWGAVALVPLVELGALSRTAARRGAAWALMALLMLALMLTGSRTGLVGVAVLLAWGALDQRLSRLARGLLLASPLVFALSWWLVDLWVTGHAGPAVGTASRLGDGDLSTGRFAIWRDTLALIARYPLSGVGYGEFNLAWTLTPFAARSPQFFDHTHNLPLQLLVELGLPLGLAVLGLLGWALWQAWARVRGVDGPRGAALRAAFVIVLLAGLHSQFEYPLWYAHFLLPTAFAWGLCLGARGADEREPEHAAPFYWPLAAGIALVLGAAVTLWDYHRVSVIFAPDEDATPFLQRIADGRHSWFFAHHADYARITALEEESPPASAEFARATHFLLDTRLLSAWARAYAREGDLERARWIADRLRELKQPAAEPFFAPCADASLADKPFQCMPATRTFTWRDFVK